ncbi:hypothetical protein CB0940_05170 [Cercospora beticola]|uniref:GPI anchored protein n=1 Tax=Cercospora beticola TaxID=122368 RepID=A0A2G5HMT0_CERBT|nr:hypothetical protein CB0940_05170 [Cercospora beticola]PIA93835.1 hypothetical protein CB0940_05170 [Cercospora beticola]
MHDRLLALPATLLALVAATTPALAHDLPWPHDLPRNAKYYPEDEPHVKRGLEAQQRLQWQEPTGMKKLGDDPGEKFFMHYWEFGEADETTRWTLQRLRHHSELGVCGNATRLLPPLEQHASDNSRSWSIFGRDIFARDFECPGGTTSCRSIGSDLCCQSGETCVNTSEGVGCCPPGATCGNEVGECDTAAGYSSCPGDGAGCCIPGAACVEGGCAFYGTATVTTNLPAPTTSSQRPTTIIVSESGQTTTVTVTASGEDNTQTVTVTEPTTIVIGGGTSRTCTAGFQSCPATLGGGCCRSDQICGASTSCLELTTTTSATAGPPVRPTSSDNSVSAANTEQISSTATSVVGCPTGFYMCSAVYLGGCCRVDRNCDTTSCPATASTDVVTNSGLTIAAAGGNAVPTTGSCANGWSTCAPDAGGGCCPSGYQCADNCINTAPGGSNTTKMAPDSAAPDVLVRGTAWSFGLVGLVTGVGMILL